MSLRHGFTTLRKYLKNCLSRHQRRRNLLPFSVKRSEMKKDSQRGQNEYWIYRCGRMNLLRDGEDPNNSIFVSFNQDCSNICVGTKTGYKIIKFTPEGNLEKVIEDTSDEARIVEQMYTSTLVAHVSQSSPRKLRVILHKSNSEVAQQSYANTILAVKLNKKYYVVCLEECIYIHEMTDCQKIHTIREIPANPNGICALAPDPESSLLAYPGNRSTGEVAIFDCKFKQNKLVIPAHDNPLAAVAFNYSGTKIATASERGTVIRVFNVIDGQSVYEFRRGYARCVSIYSLSFSVDSLFLCASSNTETVHIFKLEDPKDNKPHDEPQGWMGWMGKALIQSVNYLPTQVSDMLNQWRSFSIARLPFSGLKNVCGISMTGKVPRVIVASADGYLYIYDLNVNEPGECVLSKQYRLEDDGTGSDVGTGISSAAIARLAKLPGSMSYAAVVRGTDQTTAVANCTTNTPNITTTTSTSSTNTTATSTATVTSPLTSEASSSADTRSQQQQQQQPGGGASGGGAPGTAGATRSDATNAINYDGDFPPMSYKNSF